MTDKDKKLPAAVAAAIQRFDRNVVRDLIAATTLAQTTVDTRHPLYRLALDARLIDRDGTFLYPLEMIATAVGAESSRRVESMAHQ